MRKITNVAFLLIAGSLLFGCATYTTAPVGYNPSSSHNEPQKIAEFQKKIETADISTHRLKTGGATRRMLDNVVQNIGTFSFPAFRFDLSDIPNGAVVRRAVLCVPREENKRVMFLRPASINLDVVKLENATVIDKIQTYRYSSGGISYGIGSSHISSSDRELWGSVGPKSNFEWYHSFAGPRKSIKDNPCKPVVISGSSSADNFDVTDFARAEAKGDDSLTIMLYPNSAASIILEDPYLVVDYDTKITPQPAAQTAPSSPKNRLEEMKVLLDKGLITTEEYNSQKIDILKSI